jgi:cytoskeletal protein RodZ
MPSPIGHQLKAAREQRGLSLLDAAHHTKIPVQRLHLLEQDDYAGFGSMTYARAFLRRYSDYLGVDASERLDELPGGVLGGPRDYRYLTDSHGLWVAPKAQRVARLSSPVPRRQGRRSPVPAGIFIFVLVLIGTGIWGKYVADDRLAQAQAQESREKAEEMEKPLPVTHAVPLSTEARVFAPKEPVTQVLKAVPVTPEEAEFLRVNKVGKAVPVE